MMYKKIYAYLSVLLLVGSVLSSPITSMADTNFFQEPTTSTSKATPEKSVSDKKEQTVRTAKIDQVDGGKTTSSSILGAKKVFSTTAQARAPANFKETREDWEDQFITKAELQDESGNTKTDFGIYDNMQAAWNFVIPANKAKFGDTITVAIPSVLTLVTVTKFDITDAGGTVIGHAVADPKTGKITITLTDAVKDNHNAITGNFKLWVQWNTSEVEQDTTIPVEWGQSGSTDIHISSSNSPDQDELLYKFGWYDSNNPSIIHWLVRINYAKREINNAIYTDLVGDNQALVSGSISAYKVEFKSDGENFDVLSTYPVSATSENGTSGFKTTLGDLKGPVFIEYDTNITNNGDSARYENSGHLTGDNIERQTVDVYSPDNGGGGNVDTTTTISGIKTWQDNNNQDGQRPSSITVNLLANGKQIQSQKVTATDKWQYSFKDLPEYDTDGQKITYTVTEDKVTNYTTKIEDNNLINSYTPKQTSVTVTKTWQDHENQDGLRPDSIKVQLYANGEKQGDVVTLTQAKKWTYTWQGLAAKQNGKDIKYTVKEVGTVAGYTSTVNDKNQGNIVITNSHTPNHKQHDTKPTQPSNSGSFTPTKETNQAKKNKPRKYNSVGKWLIRHHLLPQTGEQEATGLLILGLGLLLFVTVAGVIVVNRRRSN